MEVLMEKFQFLPALHKDNICISLSKANRILSMFPSEFIFWLGNAEFCLVEGKVIFNL